MVYLILCVFLYMFHEGNCEQQPSWINWLQESPRNHSFQPFEPLIIEEEEDGDKKFDRSQFFTVGELPLVQNPKETPQEVVVDDLYNYRSNHEKNSKNQDNQNDDENFYKIYEPKLGNNFNTMGWFPDEKIKFGEDNTSNETILDTKGDETTMTPQNESVTSYSNISTSDKV